jgi:hypothetical protein
MEVADGGGGAALFDLAEDPREKHNVVARCPEVARELREELRASLAGARVGDAMDEEATTVVAKRLAELGYIS